MIDSMREHIKNTIQPKVISSASDLVFRRSILYYFTPLFLLPILFLGGINFATLFFVLVSAWLFTKRFSNLSFLFVFIYFLFCFFTIPKLQSLLMWDKGIMLLTFIYAGAVLGWLSALIFSIPDLMNYFQSSNIQLENTFGFLIKSSVLFQISFAVTVLTSLSLLSYWLWGHLNYLNHQKKDLDLKISKNQKYLCLGYLSNTFASELESSIEKLQYLTSSLMVHSQNLDTINKDAMLKRLEVMNRQLVRIDNLGRQLSFNPNFSNLDIINNTDLKSIIDSILSLFFDKMNSLDVQVYKVMNEKILIQAGGSIISQVVVPLIENALDSIANNPFRSSSGNWIRIKTESIDDFLVLTIVNSGDPVSNDHWSSQMNLAFSEIEGLGKNQNLFLVKRLIDNLGGEFSFFNHENHGAIRWTLPMSLFEKNTARNKRHLLKQQMGSHIPFN